MKLLAIPIVLAAVAKAQYLNFLNDIPVNANYTIGTDFVLLWEPQLTTATFTLELSAYNDTPRGYYTGPWGAQVPDLDSIHITLDASQKFSDGHYIWKFKTLDDKGLWKGPGFSYWFKGSFRDSYGGYYGLPTRSFHIVDAS